jgi:hypothetical protein
MQGGIFSMSCGLSEDVSTLELLVELERPLTPLFFFLTNLAMLLLSCYAMQQLSPRKLRSPRAFRQFLIPKLDLRT